MTAGRLLTRVDLLYHPGGLRVTVRSSKTIRDTRDEVVIPEAAAPGSPYCPVAASRLALCLAPAPLTAPVFLLPGTLTPLMAHQLTTMLRTVLRRRGHHAWSRVTLQSSTLWSDPRPRGEGYHPGAPGPSMPTSPGSSRPQSQVALRPFWPMVLKTQRPKNSKTQRDN